MLHNFVRQRLRNVFTSDKEIVLANRIPSSDELVERFKDVKDLGIYLHIPFCRQICSYCPYNRMLYEPELAARYTAAVKKEIAFYSSILGTRPVTSLYIGGGTPTTMLDSGLAQILESIHDVFDVRCDIHMESHPNDLSDRNLDKIRSMGVQHLSTGVEALQDRHLKNLGRSLTRIGPQRILDYIVFRKRAGAAPNTIHKEKAALSSIFSFYVDREMLPGNPVLAVRKKLRIKLVRPNYAPTMQEVIKILNRISHYSRRFFLCLWATGARYSEIHRANVGDVDLEEKTIRLVRKGGKIQTVGLNNVALGAIKEEFARRGNPAPAEPLFTNRLGKRTGKIHHALEDACEKAGVPYITHHSLRHSFARTLRRSGYTMQQIGKLLGHESGSSMTVMYADMADDEVIETAKRVTFEQIEKVIKK